MMRVNPVRGQVRCIRRVEGTVSRTSLAESGSGAPNLQCALATADYLRDLWYMPATILGSDWRLRGKWFEEGR